MAEQLYEIGQGNCRSYPEENLLYLSNYCERVLYHRIVQGKINILTTLSDLINDPTLNAQRFYQTWEDNMNCHFGHCCAWLDMIFFQYLLLDTDVQPKKLTFNNLDQCYRKYKWLLSFGMMNREIYNQEVNNMHTRLINRWINNDHYVPIFLPGSVVFSSQQQQRQDQQQKLITTQVSSIFEKTKLDYCDDDDDNIDNNQESSKTSKKLKLRSLSQLQKGELVFTESPLAFSWKSDWLFCHNCFQVRIKVKLRYMIELN